jgi:hypothetical protein
LRLLSWSDNLIIFNELDYNSQRFNYDNYRVKSPRELNSTGCDNA